MSRKGKSRDRKETRAATRQEEWEIGSDCQWSGISLGNDGNVMELNCSDGCGQLTCYYKQHMLKWLKWWILLCDFISKKKICLKKKTICWPLSMSVEYYCSDHNHGLWKQTSWVWTQAPHVRAVCLGWSYLITSQSFPYITCKYGANISCLRL